MSFSNNHPPRKSLIRADFSQLLLVANALGNLEVQMNAILQDSAALTPTEHDLKAIEMVWKKYLHGCFVAEDLLKSMYRI
jgi:hypothetical protein